MAPTDKPAPPHTDYLSNDLQVGDTVSYIGTGMNDKPRLYRGTIVVLDGTQMCVRSGGLTLVKGQEFTNPDRIMFQSAVFQHRPDGDA